MNAFDLGPEPTWHTCACGAQSNVVPCWTCSEAKRRASERDRAKLSAADVLPARYRWASLGHADLSRRVQLPGGLTVRDAAQRVLGSPRVLLHGPSGSGKTSLAFACLRDRLPDAMWTTAGDIGSARGQHHMGDGEASLIERCIAAPLLLVDEVKPSTVRGANEAFVAVVDKRHDRDLPTWVTTGMTREQLVAAYGDGILRRLTEHGYVQGFGR